MREPHAQFYLRYPPHHQNPTARLRQSERPESHVDGLCDYLGLSGALRKRHMFTVLRTLTDQSLCDGIFDPATLLIGAMGNALTVLSPFQKIDALFLLTYFISRVDWIGISFGDSRNGLAECGLLVRSLSFTHWPDVSSSVFFLSPLFL